MSDQRNEDEARHAGFLNRALVAEGIVIDLPSLSGTRPVTWFPLNWVLYSVYLSEKIGYWRYILIDRHLKANPENAFAPLFDFILGMRPRIMAGRQGRPKNLHLAC